MDLRAGLLLIACGLVFACDKEEEAKGDETKGHAAKGDDAKGDDAKGDDAKGDDAKGDDAKGDGGDDGAAAGDDEYADAIRECPKTLSGVEKQTRVITKECGTVEVTGSYRVDGGTLVLDAGAALAFKDGADITVGYSAPGKLVVRGTADDPVVFTSGGDKAAGVWKGVRLRTKSARSNIDGLVVEYAGDCEGAVKVDAPDIVFKNSTVRHAKEAGVVADTNESRFAEFAGNKFEDVGKVAMRVTPLVAGDISADNGFPGDAEIHVKANRLQESATWHAVSAPLVVVGEVRVEGREATRATLEIEAGAQVLFDGDGALTIGYAAEGGLIAKGTADKPIVFAAHERKEPGAWRGITLSSKGEADLARVELHHGGKRDKDGALLVDNRSRASVDHVKFADNVVGMVVRGRESELRAFTNNTFSGTPIAMQLVPDRLGDLGDGNKYEGDARIIVSGGSVNKDQTMKLQPGAKVELEGALRFDKGTFEFPAGYTLHIKDGSRIQVGYVDIATLKLMGTEAEPVRFIGLRDEPGAWKSVTFHAKAKGNVLQHVVVRNGGDKAAVIFERDSEGKVDHLTGEKCEGAVLLRHKDAKVEASEIKAADGTPSAE